MSTLISKAHVFGTRAHKGQVRKYTGEPYFTHCEAVAGFVSDFTSDENVIAAALLHDTVEDCDTQIEEIAEKFGDTVAEYVWYLTKPPAFVGNREARKKQDRMRLSCAPDQAKLIKCMDLRHNSLSIKKHDPDFWKTFSKEAVLLLDAMQAGDVISKYCGESYKERVFIPWFKTLLEESK